MPGNAVKLASLFGHSAVGYTITYASVSTYYVSQPLVLGNVKLANVVAGQAAVCYIVCGCGPHTMALDLGRVCVVVTPHLIEISVFTAVVGAHNSM